MISFHRSGLRTHLLPLEAHPTWPHALRGPETQSYSWFLKHPVRFQLSSLLSISFPFPEALLPDELLFFPQWPAYKFLSLITAQFTSFFAVFLILGDIPALLLLSLWVFTGPLTGRGWGDPIRVTSACPEPGTAFFTLWLSTHLLM